MTAWESYQRRQRRTNDARPKLAEPERALTAWSLLAEQWTNLETRRRMYGLQRSTAPQSDPIGCAWIARGLRRSNAVYLRIDEGGHLQAEAFDRETEEVLGTADCGDVFGPGMLDKLIPFLDEHIGANGGTPAKPAGPRPSMAGFSAAEIQERLRRLREEG